MHWGWSAMKQAIWVLVDWNKHIFCEVFDVKLGLIVQTPSILCTVCWSGIHHRSSSSANTTAMITFVTPTINHFAVRLDRAVPSSGSIQVRPCPEHGDGLDNKWAMSVAWRCTARKRERCLCDVRNCEGWTSITDCCYCCILTDPHLTQLRSEVSFTQL